MGYVRTGDPCSTRPPSPRRYLPKSTSCLQHLPSTLPFCCSWTSYTCTEGLSQLRAERPILSTKDLPRCRRASGIIPTSATFSQCYNLFDLGSGVIRGKEVKPPPFLSCGDKIAHTRAFLDWELMREECLFFFKMTKGG